MYRIGIIGMGALGVMYAQHFTEALGKEQVAVLADEKRLKEYKRDGFCCNGRICDFSYVLPQEMEAPPELLIFAVKYGGLQPAIETVHNCVGKNTLVLSVLNGISSEEMLIEAFGKEKVLYCVAQKMDAGKEGSNVQYTHMGELAIGELHGEMTDRVLRVQEIFQEAKLPYVVPEDMEQFMWSKLLCNTGVNQTTMIFEGTYSLVQREGEPRELMIKAMREVIDVAQAKNISLSEKDLEGWLAVLDLLNPEGETSMRQDGKARRKTEVELFAGTICKMGKELGIPTPINDHYYKEIKQREELY